MTVETLVTDPALTPLLQTSQACLKAALHLIELSSQGEIDAPDTSKNDSEIDVFAQAAIPDSHVRKLLLAQKELHSYLSILRGQNRAAILGVRATKAQTAEARQEIDRLQLQLQNLYYEQQHFMGEIGACESYDHAYMHLPLIPVEEYLSLFPDETQLPETDLMPLRIEHERKEREKLEEQRQELLKKKAELVAENNRRKDDLKKLDERMEKFLEGAKGIMEVLEKEYS